MPITPPPIIPQITDPSTFATRAQAWVVWQANELYPALEDSSTVLSLSTSSTSTTSNTIGTGSKSFTVETGKGYLAGQSLSIAYTTTPTNRMFAVVTSYNSGTGALVVNVQAIEGSGTFTDWSIALAFNGVISAGQIGANAVTLAKLARVGTAGQVLTSGGAGEDPSYTSLVQNSISQLDSSDKITDSGSNGMRELTLDGVVRERQTSSARLSTIDGGSTLYPEFKCRAWVNFDGTGTVAIRASGNVSSVTDIGTGTYNINFITSMPDANYSVGGGVGLASGSSGSYFNPHDGLAPTISFFRLKISNTTPAIVDRDYINVNVFR